MMREPLDWENTPQSSGLTFEGSVDRLRFAASTPKSNRRAPSQITTGFKVTLWVARSPSSSAPSCCRCGRELESIRGAQ